MGRGRRLVKDFVVVRSSWTVGQALSALARRPHATHLVLATASAAESESPATSYRVLSRDAWRRWQCIDANTSIEAAVRARDDNRNFRPVLGQSGLLGVESVVADQGAPSAGEEVACELEVSAPPVVQRGSAFAVTVTLSAGGSKAAFEAEPGEKVKIFLDVPEGVRASTTTAALAVSSDSTSSHTFSLTADTKGEHEIVVNAFLRGQSVQQLRLTVEARGAAPTHRPTSTSATLETSSASLPDMLLDITQNGPHMVFRVTSGDDLYLESFVQTLQTDALAECRELFRRIEGIPVKDDTQRREAVRRLQGWGADLFKKLFPQALREILWQRRDRIASVQICSAEAWVPWELCRLVAHDGRSVGDGPFLAEQFGVTRWIQGVPQAATLSFVRLAAVVPASNLPSAPAEREFLRSLANIRPGLRVEDIGANYLDTTDAMIQGQHDAWHFAGHGRADSGLDADSTSIELDNRGRLQPSDISGAVENMLAPRPLVFFNACQTAQGGLTFAGPGGWARRFLRPRREGPAASAFIGTYWAVDDRLALAFAMALYKALIAGEPIGAAAREARRSIQKAADPTWLAYTVYAHPNARVSSEAR